MHSKMSQVDHAIGQAFATAYKCAAFDTLAARARMGIANIGKLGLHTFATPKNEMYLLFACGQEGLAFALTLDDIGRYNVLAYRRAEYGGPLVRASKLKIPNSDIGRAMCDFVALLQAQKNEMPNE